MSCVLHPRSTIPHPPHRVDTLYATEPKHSTLLAHQTKLNVQGTFIRDVDFQGLLGQQHRGEGHAGAVACYWIPAWLH